MGLEVIIEQVLGKKDGHFVGAGAQNSVQRWKLWSMKSLYNV